MCSAFSAVVQERANLHGEFRQILMNSFPDDLQIDAKVAVGHTIAHGLNQRPRDISMSGGEIRGIALYVARCLADDFKIPDDGVLHHLVFEKR